MKTNKIKLTESQLNKVIKESVKRVLREGYQRMVRNSEGEPIGMDYEKDAYERELSDWEENMRKAEDPYYAAQEEADAWYREALRIFQSQSVQIPYLVVDILGKELRKKKEEIWYKEQQETKERELAKYKPFQAFLKNLGYRGKIQYYLPSYDDMGGIELRVYDKNGTNSMGKK